MAKESFSHLCLRIKISQEKNEMHLTWLNGINNSLGMNLKQLKQDLYIYFIRIA